MSRTSKLRLKSGFRLWVGLDHEDDGWKIRPHIQVNDPDSLATPKVLAELEGLTGFEVDVVFGPTILLGALDRAPDFDRGELFQIFFDNITGWVDDPEHFILFSINTLFVKYSEVIFEKCDDGFGGPRRLKITWLSGAGARVLARVYVPFRAVDEYFIDAD